jgi:pimeloyl-ACP methyl ester carboxylesterase
MPLGASNHSMTEGHYDRGGFHRRWTSAHLIDPTGRSHCGRPIVLITVLWLVVLTGGCTTTKYLSNRTIRENALTDPLKLVGHKGPQVSERTWDTLHRYGLEDQFKEDCAVCFAHIRELVRATPDAELIYALSELSYVEGKKAERRGDALTALNQYGVALTNSYDYLFSEDLQITRNAYDPQFRAACDLYNESLEDTLRLLCRENKIEPGHTYTIETPDRKFLVRTEMRGKWKPDEFARYEFVSDFEIETLRNRHTTYGLGVPLIAVRRPRPDEDPREEYYPKGLSYSVTAMMRCLKAENGARRGESTTCVLEFFDPLSANQINLAEQWVPLETDLTTPLAFFLDSPDFRKRNLATEGLINPNGSQENRGLYMLEPYDPNRIPVLMVHGLWSSPMTWMDMFNDLRSFPEIRERYQFWFYLYPSGQPFWLSATQLRSDLVAMRDVFDPSRRDRPMDKMVLVGHSMGGLVSRLQTIDSGDEFWKIVSNEVAPSPEAAFEKIRGPEEAKTKLVSALFFKPNHSVARVITIGTPHYGSEFANEFTRWLARKIIKLPRMAVSTGYRLAIENPTLFKDTQLLTAANAIDSLAPESAIFPVMMRAERAPGVKYHNIIGVLQKPSLLQRQVGPGDGIVELASARIPDVESELIVDADHTTIHMTGKTIFEVRRILLEHLQELDSRDRLASSLDSQPSDSPASDR